MDEAFAWETLVRLLWALPTTLALFVLSIAIGCVLALGLTAMRLSGNTAWSRFARAYIYVFRGTPLLIQMFLVYYGLGQFSAVRASVLWPVLKEPFNCAVLSLALCNAAYSAEIFRGGVLAVPYQQIEAARACGMSGLLLLRRIVAPIALRQALPSYTTELILMVKSTSLAGLVTVSEMTDVANRIIHSTYRTFTVFLIAALIYLVLNFLLVRLLAFVEHRLSPHLRVMPEASKPQPVVVG
jgi:octopine/nopaline transport system permease protein